MKKKRNLSAQLYTFVDTGYLRGRKPEEIARELCAGGADFIQLRAKTSTPEQIQQMAEAILPITRSYGVRLVINDQVAVAKKVKADYVHLGQEDFFDHGYTQTASLKSDCPELKIGLSTHAPEEARRAIEAGADYIAIGPVYPTPTKPGAKAVTLDYVRWAAANVSIPWFAIGGITLENVNEVLAAGARGICVVSAILNAPSVLEACQAFKARLSSVPAIG